MSQIISIYCVRFVFFFFPVVLLDMVVCKGFVEDLDES